MIHPRDFDATPEADTSAEDSGAGSKRARPWQVACGLLAALSVAMTVAWMRASEAATVEKQQYNVRIAGLIQEQEALRSALSTVEAQAAATARDVHVSVTQVRLGGVVNGVLTEPPEPVEFVGAGLTSLQYAIEGRHPLCGKAELKQPITVTFTMPDGAVFKTAESPADATSVMPASCAAGEAQWSIRQSFGYQTPGLFALGTWRVVITDRGATVAQTTFAVR
jgi:hypothetical protein